MRYAGPTSASEYSLGLLSRLCRFWGLSFEGVRDGSMAILQFIQRPLQSELPPITRVIWFGVE